MSDALLEVRDLCCYFGGLRALDGVNLHVQRGTVHGVIGPNGAGKTTLFNVITGRIRPTAGRIFFQGREITNLPQHEIARIGIARSYQITTIFKHLTVIDNVRIALQRAYAFHLWRDSKSIKDIEKDSANILESVGLLPKAHLLASQLSHGEQRHLDIAIALACRPTLLLLDEPTAGMSPKETEDVARLIDSLRKDLTIVLVEHKMQVVMTLCDRITVLHFGRVLAEGTPAEVRSDPRVQEAYLGRTA